MHVAVTGASGFVAQAMLQRMASREAWRVTGLTRQPAHPAVEGVNYLQPPEAPDASWPASLERVDVLVHAAARVHVHNNARPDALAELQRVNVAWTLNLAREAASRGVRRFLFLSTVKVHGEATAAGHPFTAEDPMDPMDAYALSKAQAESGLREIARSTGMELVVVRPPLVYGPGVRANFASMLRFLSIGLPLPLGSVDNRRSLVGLDNLVDLLVTCCDHPAAAGQDFLVSDGDDLSTPDLLRRAGLALGRPARLLPVPETWLRGIGSLLGRQALVQRLCDSLQVDIGKTRRLLGWSPPFGVDEGLRRTAAEYLARQKDART